MTSLYKYTSNKKTNEKQAK